MEDELDEEVGETPELTGECFLCLAPHCTRTCEECDLVQFCSESHARVHRPGGPVPSHPSLQSAVLPCTGNPVSALGGPAGGGPGPFLGGHPQHRPAGGHPHRAGRGRRAKAGGRHNLYLALLKFGTVIMKSENPA